MIARIMTIATTALFFRLAECWLWAEALDDVFLIDIDWVRPFPPRAGVLLFTGIVLRLILLRNVKGDKIFPPQTYVLYHRNNN